MDSCFGLVRPHQHGIAVGQKIGLKALCSVPLTAEASVFEGSFPSTSSRGGYIWRGDLTEGFLRYRFGEGGGALIHGGAYFRNLQ